MHALCYVATSLKINLLYFFVELVCESVSHHCLPSARRSMKEHHHTSTIGDGIIQTHLLTAPLVGIKVADRVQDQLLLFIANNHLQSYKLYIGRISLI